MFRIDFHSAPLAREYIYGLIITMIIMTATMYLYFLMYCSTDDDDCHANGKIVHTELIILRANLPQYFYEHKCEIK